MLPAAWDWDWLVIALLIRPTAETWVRAQCFWLSLVPLCLVAGPTAPRGRLGALVRPGDQPSGPVPRPSPAPPVPGVQRRRQGWPVRSEWSAVAIDPIDVL